jgi:hypothetical protein
MLDMRGLDVGCNCSLMRKAIENTKEERGVTKHLEKMSVRPPEGISWLQKMLAPGDYPSHSLLEKSTL